MSQTIPGIVEIEWVDATHHSGWEYVEERREQLAKCASRYLSVGYLLESTRDHIAVSLSLAVDHDKVAETMVIPRSAVKKLTVIRKAQKGGK